MLSEHTPPGTRAIALRTGCGIECGRLYTVRGFVLNRHWRTREPDPHVLLEEAFWPRGQRGEVGFPRDAARVLTAELTDLLRAPQPAELAREG